MEEEIEDLQIALGNMGEDKEDLSLEIETMATVFKKFVQITKERTNVVQEITKPKEEIEEKEQSSPTSTKCVIA